MAASARDDRSTTARALGALGVVVALGVTTFGLVAARSGAVRRWVALALAAGSLLGMTGMDRLRLTSPANSTIFAPLALAALGLEGLALVLVGIEMITDGPRQRAPRLAVTGDGSGA